MKRIALDFKHFKGDLLGGITAGIVALPLALAFGLQSGLGAVAGLYGAIFIGFFAALFGGTNTQISGPTAPMTAVTMVLVTGVVAHFDGQLEKAMPAILTIFILSGLIQIVLGVFKIGKYIAFIPYPVVSGFMSGIGVIIIVTQLLPLLGYYPVEDTAYVEEFKPVAEETILRRLLHEEAEEDLLVLEDFQETIRRAQLITQEDIMAESRTLAGGQAGSVIGSLRLLPRALLNIHWVDLIMALLTIGIIYGFKYVTNKLPSTLVALISVTIAATLFLEDYRTIGHIPSGFPKFYFGIVSDFDAGLMLTYLMTAFSLALLGSIDSLLTSVVADNLTKTKHKPNQELMGQGIGNIMAGFFGGIPGAGATIRTVVNIDAGGKTRLSGMIAAMLLLLILLVLGPAASRIPAAVLAGILITVGIGIMDYKGLRHIGQWPRSEVVVMLIVLILTIAVGLLQAVIIGMILASILFMKTISDVVDHSTQIAPMQSFSHELPWQDEGDIISRLGDKVYIKHLRGPLFFGFATRFQEMVKALPQVEVVVIRMEEVPYIDQSGLYAMDEAIQELIDQDIKVAITGLHGQPDDLLRRFNLIPGLISEDLSFEDFDTCAKWIDYFLKFHHEPHLLQGEDS